MKALLIAEHDNKTLKSCNLHTVSAAAALNADIDLLIVGYECDAAFAEAKKIPHIKRILVANAKEYQHQLAENMAAFIADVARDYDYVVSAATTFSKNLLPRVAALLDVAMVADVVKVVSPDTFVRPIYAGNALATVATQDKIKVLTFRTTAFPAIKTNGDQPAAVETISKVVGNDVSQFENQQLTVSARPELTSAKIIISGGRGLKSADNFKLLEDIADKLGAAIGASRAAVDAGFAPNDYQVGQTGKVVAPDLYIAVGISGAIQHLAGMKDSKVIVAINSDPDAPIFQIADYGLVGDLFQLLPELSEKISK